MTATISAESLRYVRTCSDLSSAERQCRHAEYALSRKEQFARDTGGEREAKMAEAARESLAAWQLRVRELGGDAQDQPEPTPEPMPQRAKPQPKAEPRKAPCLHRSSIWRFRKAAQDMGLDMEAKDRRRGAVGMLLGRRIESCSEMSGPEWEFCALAIRQGRLFW